MSPLLTIDAQVSEFNNKLDYLTPESGLLGGRFFVSRAFPNSKKVRFNELVLDYRQLYDSLQKAQKLCTDQTGIINIYGNLRFAGMRLLIYANRPPKRSFSFLLLLTKIRRFIGNWFFKCYHRKDRDAYLQDTVASVTHEETRLRALSPSEPFAKLYSQTHSQGDKEVDTFFATNLPPSAPPLPIDPVPARLETNQLNKTTPLTPQKLLEQWKICFCRLHTEAHVNKSLLQSEMMQIAQKLRRAGAALTPEKQQQIEKEERWLFLSRQLEILLQRNHSGSILIPETPEWVKLLTARGVTLAPSEQREPSYLILDSAEEKKLFEAVAKASIAFDIVSQKLKESFQDEEGSWEVFIQKQTQDRYSLQMRKDSLRGRYSLFAFLRELGFIRWEQIFHPEKPLPDLREADLIRIQTFFESQEKFSTRFKQVFQELDPTAGAVTGSESISNFYGISIEKGMSDEAFLSQLKIPRAVVDQIRREKGSVVYPAAVQMQTKSDAIMHLLERYYKDFNFKDRKGQSKTFIIETRAPGLVHRSNIPEDQFNKLNEKLLFLISAKKICKASTLADIVTKECEGTLNEEILAAISGKFIEFFYDPTCTLSMNQKNALISQFIAGQSIAANNISLKNSKEIEGAILGHLKPFLLKETSLGEKSRTFPKNNLPTQEIKELLYPKGYPESDELRLKALEEILKADDFLQQVIPQVQAFFSTANKDANITSDNADLLEKCVFRLKKRDLPQERYQRFAKTFNEINWVGCATGFRIKLIELCQKLILDESIDFALWERRNELVTLFSAMKYNDAGEGVMYLASFQKALNDEFGILEKTPQTANWLPSQNSKDLIAEARAYLTSHYTPFYIYKAIQASFADKIKHAIASDLSHEVRKVLMELGIEDKEGNDNPMNRYYNEIDGSFDQNVIQFDLPFLVSHYCLRNNYLQWGGEKYTIDSKYDAEAHNF